MKPDKKLATEDKRIWRRWQAGWVCFYLLLAAALFAIGGERPSPHAEFAQSAPAGMKRVRAPP